jgi:hypothetical protein
MKFSEIEDMLTAQHDDDCTRYADGSITMGNPRNFASLRCMHILFAPAPSAILQKLVDDFEEISKFPYLHELSEHNGLDIFFGDFLIYGARVAFKKGNAPYTVFDVFSHNRDFYQIGLSRGRLVIGSNKNTAENHLVQDISGKTSAIDIETGKITEVWPNFETLVRKEIERLSKKYSDLHR